MPYLALYGGIMATLVEFTFFSSKLDEMVKFYQTILEVTPIVQSPGIAIFQTSTVQIILHENYPAEPGKLDPESHMALSSRNLDKTRQSLGEKGIVFENEPKDYEWGRSIYLRDPDGHLVELLETQVDWSQAHYFFSAACFNRAWEFIEKPDRNDEDDEQMVSLVQASLYHWSQRSDTTNQNRSVGYWQASRVYSLVKQADNARKYGLLCLKFSQNEPPFYIGYAYEALARAEMVAGDNQKAQEYLIKAREMTGKIIDTEEKELLVADLDSLEKS